MSLSPDYRKAIERRLTETKGVLWPTELAQQYNADVSALLTALAETEQERDAAYKSHAATAQSYENTLREIFDY